MVARYWGKKFSVNRIRDIANVDANGASLRGLSAAAESIGFSTRPVKASIDQLAKQNYPQSLTGKVIIILSFMKSLAIKSLLLTLLLVNGV